mmetsp:Transcript_7927/g.25899  ORF Transcript_7927/g.25899 Transcript_7927/m.25899 type:complete len:228 (+) Transcript_7927:2515-3198(+)
MFSDEHGRPGPRLALASARFGGGRVRRVVFARLRHRRPRLQRGCYGPRRGVQAPAARPRRRRARRLSKCRRRCGIIFGSRCHCLEQSSLRLGGPRSALRRRRCRQGARFMRQLPHGAAGLLHAAGAGSRRPREEAQACDALRRRRPLRARNQAPLAVEGPGARRLGRHWGAGAFRVERLRLETHADRPRPSEALEWPRGPGLLRPCRRRRHGRRGRGCGCLDGGGFR